MMLMMMIVIIVPWHPLCVFVYVPEDKMCCSQCSHEPFSFKICNLFVRAKIHTKTSDYENEPILLAWQPSIILSFLLRIMFFATSHATSNGWKSKTENLGVVAPFELWMTFFSYAGMFILRNNNNLTALETNECVSIFRMW